MPKKQDYMLWLQGASWNDARKSKKWFSLFLCKTNLNIYKDGF